MQVHVSLGHCTVMAEVTYFGTPDGSGHEPAAALRLVLDRIGQLALNVSPCFQLHLPHHNYLCATLHVMARSLQTWGVWDQLVECLSAGECWGV